MIGVYVIHVNPHRDVKIPDVPLLSVAFSSNDATSKTDAVKQAVVSAIGSNVARWVTTPTPFQWVLTETRTRLCGFFARPKKLCTVRVVEAEMPVSNPCSFRADILGNLYHLKMSRMDRDALMQFSLYRDSHLRSLRHWSYVQFLDFSIEMLNEFEKFQYADVVKRWNRYGDAIATGTPARLLTKTRGQK